jgi:predicted negative regulator of RcsB-dependent stress response
MKNKEIKEEIESQAEELANLLLIYIIILAFGLLFGLIIMNKINQKNFVKERYYYEQHIKFLESKSEKAQPEIIDSAYFINGNDTIKYYERGK